MDFKTNLEIRNSWGHLLESFEITASPNEVLINGHPVDSYDVDNLIEALQLAKSVAWSIQ